MKRANLSLFLGALTSLGAIAFAIAIAKEAPYEDSPEKIFNLGVILFFVLLVMVELNYVLLPHGRTISGSFGIVLATMLVFNTVIAVSIAVSASVITGGFLKSRPKEPVLFRTAQYALVYSAGGIAMQLISQHIPGIVKKDFTRMLLLGGVVLFVYLILHIPLNNVYLKMLGTLDKKTGWAEEELRQQTGNRHEIITTIFLFPVAVTMAFSYKALNIPFIPIILAVLCILTVRYLGQMQLHKKLWGQANLDGLLEIFNRRYMLAKLAEELRIAQLYRRSLSTMLIDLDNFKEVNDTHGHLTGDHVLKAVTKTVNTSIRSADIPARFGGDELLVIMPGTPLEGAFVIASRIRKEVAALRLTGEDGRSISVTVSVGVAAIAEDAEVKTEVTPLSLIQNVDQALYKAKSEGRNRAKGADGQAQKT